MSGKKDKYISFFGSYRSRAGEKEYETAYELAFQFAKKGFTIINGGGSGIMEASTQGAKEAEGRSIGVVLKKLRTNQKNNKNDDVIFCNSLFERLSILIEKSKAFIVFSGGTGTLTELSLTWELMNKGLIKTFPIICFGDHWKPLVEILVNEPSYIKGKCSDFITFAYTVEEIISLITD